MIRDTGRRGRSGAFLAFVVAVASLSVLVPPHSAFAASAPVDLRVMEFNIEYGGTLIRFRSMVEAIQAADADVVGIEEAWGHIPRLANALDYPYYNERLQIVSRFPLIDPPHGNGVYVFVELSSGRVVALANVHLPAGPYSPNLIRRGAKRTTILEIERRVRVPAVKPAVTALSGLVTTGVPSFLLGDFNAPSRLDWTAETVGLRYQIHYPVNWPVSAYVERAGFRDSFREANPDPVTDPGLTWPSGRAQIEGAWNPGPNAPADRIDFIYAAGEATTIESATVGESGGPGVAIGIDPWGTDHRATVSEFSVLPGVAPTFVAVADRLIQAGVDQQVTFHNPDADGDHVQVIPKDDPSYPVADVPTMGATDGMIPVVTEDWIPGAYDAMLMSGDRPLSRIRFWVEASDERAHVSTTRAVYGVGDSIHVAWSNAPGDRWDWVGVYPRGADPSIDTYLTWFYTHTAIQGSGMLDAESSGPWPLPPGRYSVLLLADDGYHVLARARFRVTG